MKHETIEQFREWALAEHPTVKALPENRATIVISEFGPQWFGPESAPVVVANYFFRYAEQTEALKESQRNHQWPAAAQFGEISLEFVESLPVEENGNVTALYRRTL